MKKIALLTLAGALLFSLSACGQTNTQNQTSTADNTNKAGDLISQVSQHKTAADCWMTIAGQVYNFTDYIPQHPAGDAILTGCGQDATVMFNNIKKHDAKVVETMAQYLVK